MDTFIYYYKEIVGISRVHHEERDLRKFDIHGIYWRHIEDILKSGSSA